MRLALAVAILALAAPARAEVPEPILMTGSVSFAPEEGTLAADLRVEIPVADGASPLVFFLNAGLEVTTLRGEGLTGFTRQPMPGNPFWTLFHIEFDSEAAGDVLALDFAYSGVPAMFPSGINRVTADWIELSADSAWHPLMTTLLQPIRYDLLLDLPESWTVVGAGRTEREGEGVRLVSRVDAPDIPFTASPDLERTGDDAVSVYHRGLDADLAALVIDRAAACRDWLDTRFSDGDKRLPPLSFTVPERTVSGYARGNYIALTNLDGISERSLTEFLCHELAHHWSVGAAPMTVDNWLNEGFAVLIAAHAVRDLYGEDAYDRLVANWAERSAGAGSIWSEDDQRRRSDAASYQKAPLLLHLLEQRIGADAFAELLSRYAQQPINATPDLLGAIEEIAGSETRAWFVERLADEDDLSL